mmetsp:Transcript_13814/g.55541  ORF Transcript_13814/g.55541 Transcript_13814/m.55541 type:complete len:143 (-) Transcript_13814:5750-6178(-)
MGEERQYSLLEVARHNKRKDCWMVIHGKVYDVTSFLLDHPGGEDILVETSGRDATREFEDVGHSTEARSALKDLYVGTLREPTEEEKAEHEKNVAEGKSKSIISSENDDESFIQKVAKFLVPVLIIALGLLLRQWTAKTPET